MHAQEALEVLGLSAAASPTEIRETYRDLVKVWHPDRFGTDPKLREKAEEKLKRINQAYTALQAAPTADSSSHAEPAPQPAAPRRAYHRGELFSGVSIWAARAMGILLLVAIGIVLFRGLSSANTPDQSATQTGIDPALTPPQQSDAVPTPPDSAAQSPSSQPPALQRPSQPAAAPFTVRTLSEEQTTQLNAACDPLKTASDPSAYQACVKAQIDLLTNSAGTPDLGNLTTSERESIQSACSTVKRAAPYNHCLATQIAAWAAEPARPDLSSLSESDRRSIESACRGAKALGPAPYDRCRARLVKLLADSK